MTRPSTEMESVLQLRASGATVRAIADQLEIPRGTVSEWLYRRRPQGRNRSLPACRHCGSSGHSTDALPCEYAYLLGLYLGDGCISTHPRAYKLRIILDSSYPGIIEEADAAIHAVVERVKVNTVLRPGCTEVYAYSKGWPCLFPQHGTGKKHDRKIELAEWQWRLVRESPDLMLRGLIHSDGCRFMNTGRGWAYPRYSFA
jgi:hypothetical protein